MATSSEVRIKAPSGVFTYDQVMVLESHWSASQKVTVDLSKVEDIETAAMARLIVLRRHAIRCGGDVSLTALHGRAAARWKIHRLENLLPLAQADAEQIRQSPLSMPLTSPQSAGGRGARGYGETAMNTPRKSLLALEPRQWTWGNSRNRGRQNRSSLALWAGKVSATQSDAS